MNITEEKFYEIYYSNILPKFKISEPQRKQILITLFIKELLLLLIILLFILFLIISFKSNVFNSEGIRTIYLYFIVFLFPFVAIICGIKMYQIYKNTINLKNIAKQDIIKHYSKALSIKWFRRKPLSTLPLYKTDIFPAYTKIEYDDIFQGIHNNSEFDVQEIKLILKGDKMYKKVFKGIVICVPSNKKIKAQTIITSKGDYKIFNRAFPIYVMIIAAILILYLGILSWGNIGSGKIIAAAIFIIYFIILQIQYEQRLQKVKLEDLKFDKRFNVYSEDQIEARYLVTPTFMERLQNLKTAFRTKDIKCSFFDDKVMFAISTKDDLFEIGNLFVPLTDKKQIEKFYKELTSIYNMIDYFKLTQKTGL